MLWVGFSIVLSDSIANERQKTLRDDDAQKLRIPVDSCRSVDVIPHRCVAVMVDDVILLSFYAPTAAHFQDRDDAFQKVAPTDVLRKLDGKEEEKLRVS